ncbi:MAG: hypothetical protein P1V51_19805 [Deltaproteobacteria bacterium]|nr:hypothetical protein [Deltaproteobacteria bacterium]
MSPGRLIEVHFNVDELEPAHRRALAERVAKRLKTVKDWFRKARFAERGRCVHCSDPAEFMIVETGEAVCAPCARTYAEDAAEFWTALNLADAMNALGREESGQLYYPEDEFAY